MGDERLLLQSHQPFSHHTTRSAAFAPEWQHQPAAEPLCATCLPEGRITPATDADHVIPHRGDQDLFWQGELQSLCAACHSLRKQSQEKGGQKPDRVWPGW
jgi:hypothetical protein